MLRVCYSSFILYFGAEFTKTYAVKHGSKIRPNEYAVTVHLVRIDTGKESIQDNEDYVKKRRI
jgi:membrane protein